MKSGVIKSLYLMSIPVGSLLLAYALWPAVQSDPALARLVRHAPHVLFGAALALAWRFNQSRVFFMLLVFLVGYLFVTGWAGQAEYAVVYTAVSILVPVNTLLFAFLKERGILTTRGKCYLAFLPAQVLVVALWWAAGEEAVQFLQTGVLNSGSMHWTPLPVLSVLLFLAAVVGLTARMVYTQSFADGCSAGALAAAALGLHFDSVLELSYFTAVAGLILLVAVLQRMYAMAYLDELTGLPGRRALREEKMKLGDSFTLALVDVDHFKQFNDRYGHAAGDEVLRFVASFLRQVSGGGKAFRYGGEEFVLVFPGRGLKDTLPHLETLREKIAGRPFVLRGKDRSKEKPPKEREPRGSNRKVTITVSVGAAEKRREHKTCADVFRAADAALYRAKQKGRNRVST